MKINADILPPSFSADIKNDKRKEIIDIAEDALDKTENFWTTSRHDTLNRNERQKMDTMVYEAGKGDRYRKVDKEKFANNYDLIFGKKKNEPVQDSPSA